MSDPVRTRRAIDSSDTDELLRIVEGHCRGKDWDGLIDLRQQLAEAIIRGKQLWGVDEHIRYRLALHAPPRFAAEVVVEGPARFTLGPLSEVAASTHLWEELEPLLPPGPERDSVAAERVVRGETIREAVKSELPLHLESWEPAYPVAEFHADKIDAPTPPMPDLPEAATNPAQQIDDAETTLALAGLVTAWTEESNGRAQTAAVEGDALGAIGALGPSRVRLAKISPELALAWMAWAAASGGAHGRRRGAASGRFGAWWAAAALSDLEWPPPPDVLGKSVNSLGWYLWSDLAPPTGWTLYLAVEDQAQGLAWAIAAIDAD
jgi:hypothetical protein